MENFADRISERLLIYGANIVKYCGKLTRTFAGRHIGGQLLRCGTSAGANYEEARGAQSRADFLHKLQIVLKEIRESIYWLKLLQYSGLVRDDESSALVNESQQLAKIIAKSIITAKKNDGPRGTL